MRIYLKNNPVFHPGPIWNDGTLGFLKFFEEVARTS